MLIVPLDPVAAQTVQVQLGGQACSISVYQKSTALYLDLEVAGEPIISGVICQNLNRIVRDTYLGFVGDLCFIDNIGTTDPVYTGLGTRYSLAYLTTEDLPAGVG